VTDGHDDRILGYLDGSLPPEETERLDQALQSDPALGARFAQLALLEQLLPEAGPEESPEIEILDVPRPRPMRFTRRTRRTAPPVWTPLPWGKLIAGALLGLAAVFILTRRPEPDPEPPVAEVHAPQVQPGVAEPEPTPPPPLETPAPPPSPTPENPVPPVIPAPPPAPPPTPAPPPVEQAPKPRESRTLAAAWATVVRVDGRSPFQVGAELRPGDALETGPSTVAVRYPDGTVIEAQADTSIADAATDGRAGKTLILSRGTIAAQVAAQPAGAPFVFQTPHAEVTVIGTRLSLAVTSSSTRLDVREGRVRFARKGELKPVEVTAGQFAAAGAGAGAVAKKPAEEPPPLYKFDFEDGRRPDPWDGGVIEAGPKREGNKYCLNVDKLSVTIGAKKPLALRYSDELVLTFDHWVAPAGNRLSIRIVNSTQGLTHTFTVLQPVGEAWGRFSMPIKDLFGESPRRFREGDRLSSVTLFVESRPKAAFYVDNLEITEKKK
jgi:ferric-dicitrate binding protein FerR (iron transport regulator)